ncbi:BMP family lipoprotein [Christensenella tenuis]|jgi:basic membrane protein A and related proteins|uniref:BMP family ABC transporter substrate-binding protein n=1 Tax=Christensenella tenuis TaxID=2763033 RepID=A0ABR7EFX4_9FIRM|nr:BMP family ABC transporter substrate-binding protein [Christensenella tenuis]MBC5648306.1 BMP family ABC transporter substrate-binding protein [Christensenella tenuis]
MKKVVVLMLTVLIVLSVLMTGCTAQEPAQESSAAQSTENESTAQENGEGESEAGSKPAAGKTLNVALVADLGGINDQSFNQSAWEGMQKLEADLGYQVKYLESAQESDFGSNLDKLTDEEPDMIWGVGFLMADAMLNAAKTNPDQKYGIVDSSYEETPENLTSVLFKAQESSFLVGYIAGRMTETDHVGLVGPIKNPIIDQFEYGFRAGVAYAAKELDKDIAVDVQYAESFSDNAKAKAIATVMYNDGADILFAMTGGASIGVIEAAKEMDQYVIGVDRDQNYLAPENVLTSAIKNVDQVIYKITREIADGTFAGGTATSYGLAEDAVGIAPTSDQLVPADILAATDKVKEELISGTITAPLDEDSFNEFMAGLA